MVSKIHLSVTVVYEHRNSSVMMHHTRLPDMSVVIVQKVGNPKTIHNKILNGIHRVLPVILRWNKLIAAGGGQPELVFPGEVGKVLDTPDLRCTNGTPPRLDIEVCVDVSKNCLPIFFWKSIVITMRVVVIIHSGDL
jgi:hypothetical protein